jgi:hypothetical protein
MQHVRKTEVLWIQKEDVLPSFSDISSREKREEICYEGSWNFMQFSLKARVLPRVQDVM